MKKTSQRSLLFRQSVNRTEAEWVHFLDGYRKALIGFKLRGQTLNLYLVINHFFIIIEQIGCYCVNEN